MTSVAESECLTKFYLFIHLFKGLLVIINTIYVKTLVFEMSSFTINFSIIMLFLAYSIFYK